MKFKVMPVAEAIRKKLGSASWLVNTVRGVGYRLSPDVMA